MIGLRLCGIMLPFVAGRDYELWPMVKKIIGLLWGYAIKEKQVPKLKRSSN